MISPATILSDFEGAIDFVLNRRESVTGGVQVGGLGELGELTQTHMELSVLSVLIACAIAVPIGLWLGHIGKGEFAAINASNIGRAVPTLALVAFFIAYIGLGFTNMLVALTLLAIPPILTNTYVGIRQVERDLVDAARGMGLTERQVIRRIEMPLALSTIFGGIRISSVTVIATATLGPLASVDTLGRPIISANVYGGDGRLGTSIVVAVIALGADAIIAGVQRLVTPTGLKVGAGEGRRSFRPTNLFLRREQPT